MAHKSCVLFEEKRWLRIHQAGQHFCLHTCSRNTSILLKRNFSWPHLAIRRAALDTRVRERSQVGHPEGRTLQWLRVCEVNWYLYFAHVFGKYADLPKAQHAVSWRAKVAYYSKKSDGCGYVKPVSTFVCTRVREIRRFR